MNNDELLEKFENLLSERGYAGSSFEEMCRRIGVRPGRMNRVLRDTTGFSGYEVVKSYKFDIPALLLL